MSFRLMLEVERVGIFNKMGVLYKGCKINFNTFVYIYFYHAHIHSTCFYTFVFFYMRQQKYRGYIEQRESIATKKQTTDICRVVPL